MKWEESYGEQSGWLQWMGDRVGLSIMPDFLPKNFKSMSRRKREKEK